MVLCNGRIVLPAALQQKVVTMAHATETMKRKLHDSCWWPGLDAQIEFLVKHCEGCQYSRKSHPPDPILPISVPKPLGPWKCFGLDLAGPYSTALHLQQFVISIIDYYSGYPEVLMMTDVWATAIICWLRKLFAQFGCPDNIVMDFNFPAPRTSLSSWSGMGSPYACLSLQSRGEWSRLTMEPYTEGGHSSIHSDGTTLGGGDDQSPGSTLAHGFLTPGPIT